MLGKLGMVARGHRRSFHRMGVSLIENASTYVDDIAPDA
jgi:hypothetical protein